MPSLSCFLIYSAVNRIHVTSICYFHQIVLYLYEKNTYNKKFGDPDVTHDDIWSIFTKLKAHAFLQRKVTESSRTMS
jgi:hypothetical protein